MPRRVKLPDGTIHIFPDDATDAEISEVLNAPPATGRTTPEGKARSWIDTAVNALPMIGGTVGGLLGAATGIPTLGITAGPGAVIGAGTLGAGGEALRQLINRARGENGPAMPGQAVSDIALQGGIQGATEMLGGALTKGVAKGARAIYRGYLKPSLAARNVGKANEIVETALREALPITHGGEAKANRVISDLRQEVDAAVQQAQGRIDLADIARRVRAFAQRKYYKPGADLSDYRTALEVANRIDQHPSLGIPSGVTPTRIDVSVTQANQAKRALQESASPSYGAPNANATKRAMKEGARELRLDIEGATGGPTGTVAKLNAREAKLIDAARAIKQAVEREANQNKLYGVKTLASAGVGGVDYARNRDPVSALAKGAATRALLNTGTASTIAIVANRLQRQLGIGTTTAVRLAQYLASETEGESEEIP